MENKYIIFNINGGIGKNIMATAVVAAIKKHYEESRKIIVVSAWPDVFLNNPNIYRVYKSGMTPYLYEDFIENKDSVLIVHEPYNDERFFKEEKHLIETWSDICGVKYNGEKPELFLTPVEQSVASNIFRRNKPIALIQPFGGANKKYQYAWNRDLPYHQAQQIVDFLSEKYHVIQIGFKDQPQLNNVESVSASVREIFVLIMLSEKRIFIDSFCQHAAAALNLSSNVGWITNSPKVFGYDVHKNILARTDNLNDNVHNIDSLFQKYDFTGSRLHDYPFKDNNVFNIEKFLN